MSDVNLFDEDSPKPKLSAKPKDAKWQEKNLKPNKGVTKETKIGNSKRNKNRVNDHKPGSISEMPSCLVDKNHKLKYKIENAEEETDVISLVKKIYETKNNFPLASNIIEEDDDGDTEYKLKLVDTSRERIQQLTTQMKFRIKEGLGEAFYKIGYEDNGNPLGLCDGDLEQSFNSLCHISNELRVELVVQKILQGSMGMVAEIAVREIRECVKFGIKIILIGDSGSGKSTLV